MKGLTISARDRLLRSFEVRMNLRDLVEGLNGAYCEDEEDRVVEGLCYDSRAVKPGYLFFAVPGTNHDGSRFAADAVAQGAVAVAAEAPLVPDPGVPTVFVPDVRKAKARAASVFYRRPSSRLDCVGITGTNGKTTVSWMLKSILEQDGRSTGLIGTIQYQIGNRVIPSGNTTPDAVDLQRYLAEMVDENFVAAVMEVSSHALVQERTADLDFKVGVFTNLTRDHLDYHGDMESYRKAKEILFRGLEANATAVINGDDPAADAMAHACACSVLRYGFESGSDITAKVRRLDIDGFSIILKTPLGEIDVTSRLPGRFNVLNAMAAAGAAVSLGVPLSAVKVGLESIRTIRGRMESVDRGQDFRVIVDYAHTHDALTNLLSNLRPLTAGRLITVFGAGGDRDRTKRPLMAEAATLHSDVTIITSDNPRSEDPDRIIEDILKGIAPDSAYQVEPDRKRAIQTAINMARGGDIVVVAGKGHENYQILNTGTIDFDDRRVVEEALWKR